MRNIYLILVSALFLTACGGGGDDSGDKTPATSPSSANAGIIGTWASPCIFFEDNTSERRSIGFQTEDGVQIFAKAKADFQTSDCSGASYVVALAGSVAYTGEYATSICMSDKFDAKIIVASDDGDNFVEGGEMQIILLQNDLSDEIYDMTCIYNDKLLVGQQDSFYNTETSSSRPVVMDDYITYTQISSRAAARGIEGNNDSMVETMNNALQEVKNNL